MRSRPRRDSNAATFIVFFLFPLLTCVRALHCPLLAIGASQASKPKKCPFGRDQVFNCDPLFDSAFYLHSYFQLDKECCTDSQVRRICALISTQKEICAAVAGLSSCAQRLCVTLNTSTFDAFCRAAKDPKAHYLDFGIKENIPMHNGSKVVKIVLMHRDEWPLLRHWVLYHSHVFGLHNLVIMDDSIQPEPKTFLKQMQRLGLSVLRSGGRFSTVQDGMNKVFDALRWAGDYFIKLDTDEFLVKNGELPSVDKAEITRALDDLALGGQRAHTNSTGFSYVPDNSSCWPLNPVFRKGFTLKGFLCGPTFGSGDLGFHHGSSIGGFNNNSDFQIPLTLLHFQYVCYKRWAKSAAQAVESHGYIHHNATIAQRFTKLKAMQPNFTMYGCSFSSCHKVYIHWRHLEDPKGNHDLFQQLAAAGNTKEIPFRQFNSLLQTLSDDCHPFGI